METLSRDTLGLSNMQQLMLMAEAQPDKRTRCDYRKFADTITPIVQGLFSTDTLARESAIAAVALEVYIRREYSDYKIEDFAIETRRGVPHATWTGQEPDGSPQV